jgi:hypothetical protein
MVMITAIYPYHRLNGLCLSCYTGMSSRQD